MRKHGWQLPYHPLQVVAIAVFLALWFSFYVFFLPFVGRKPLEYLIMALYTPLVTCVFCVYIWCAATDPGDSGVFKSKKYHKIDNGKQDHPKISNQGNDLIFSRKNGYIAKNGDRPEPEGNGAEAVEMKLFDMLEREKSSYSDIPLSVGMLGWCPFSSVCIEQCSPEKPCDLRLCEDDMFYCSLCEVEVLKYSKHCRVCDKCVYGFDHHCRWLNNCIGRRNYLKFFILMVSALLLLILQWSVGVFVLILTFTERKRISSEIISKLGSGFSLVPFIFVVVTCTLLAMIAALELAQLFFFHILLIKKGISTYDYIIALREKEQQGVDGHQSPQMSSVSSITGLSSASSFSAFHRGAWCTPPRLFLEDEFDVVPIEPVLSASSMAKRSILQHPENNKRSGTMKISPWKLARLNTEEVSKAAAEAKMKSRILQPFWKHEHKMPPSQERQSHSISRMVPTDNPIRTNTRVRIPVEFPHEPLTQLSSDSICSSPSLTTLQLEARSAFLTSGALSSIEPSTESGLDSPEHCPFRVSSSGIEDAMSLNSSTFVVNYGVEKGFLLSRSTSDGYEASGGEDSDRVPTMIVQRSSNWSNLLYSEGHGRVPNMLKGSTSAGLQVLSPH